MPWQIILLAAIWPENLEPYNRTAVEPRPVGENQSVWQEYGLEEAETATYERPGGARKLAFTAWKFKDSTGAMSAYRWLAPADSQPVKNVRYSARNAQATLASYGNYVVRFEGYRPSSGEIGFWIERLPGYKTGSLPALPTHLPEEGRTPYSERYIVGPESLKLFAPEVPLDALGFSYGTEAMLAKYGATRMLLIGFPNHAIARKQLPLVEQTSGGATVKRSGPLVAVAFGPSAETVAAKVKYDQQAQFSETVATKMPPVADMILAIFELTGLLLVVCVGGGLSVAAFLIWQRRARGGGEEPMTTLKI